MKDLLSIRKERNLTQKALGEIINVSDVQVGRIEAGTYELTLRQYKKLCDALKLTSEEAQKLLDEALENNRPQRQRRYKVKPNEKAQD